MALVNEMEYTSFVKQVFGLPDRDCFHLKQICIFCKSHSLEHMQMVLDFVIIYFALLFLGLFLRDIVCYCILQPKL